MTTMPPAGSTRRTFLTRLTVGLTGGVMASLISACSSAAPNLSAPTAAGTAKPAAAATSAPAAGAGRGTGGNLKVLMWQGPTILNSHLAQGTKDNIAARFCCEPLMTVSGDGTFSPVLASEVPSKANGGLGAD